MNDSDAPPLPNPRGGNRVKRAAYAVLGVAAAVIVIALGFFFVTLILIAGALLAIVIAVRWWWIMRRLRKARDAAGPLEGDYTVIDQDGGGRRLR
jgi:Flp pilus assembly protein TadB